MDQPNWRPWLCVPCAKHVWPVGRASCNQLIGGLHRHVQPLAGGGMPPHRRLIRKLAGQWPAPAQCIGQARGLLRHNDPAPAAVPEIGRPEACSGTRKTEHAKFCFQHWLGAGALQRWAVLYSIIPPKIKYRIIPHAVLYRMIRMILLTYMGWGHWGTLGALHGACTQPCGCPCGPQ